MRRQLGIASLLWAAALAWAVAGSAAVLAAPTAITGPVGSVGPTSAIVSGSVNPGGQATTWYVEYGTSTSYGSQSASASVGSGSANVAVSRSLAGLAAGTTYHYRVVATNGAGTSRGADGIFTTLSAPIAVTGTATGVSPSGATLNGSVDPNGRATTWYFEYGTSTSYGTRTAVKDAGSGASAVAVSAALGEPRPRPRLPLPAGRVERRGSEPRRRQDFRNVRSACRHDRCRIVGGTDVGAAERHDHRERAVDDLVLRLRHEHEVRHENGGQGSGVGDGCDAGERAADPAPDRRHLPLSPRRDERIRDDVRRQSDLQHGVAARRPYGGVARCDRDDRDPDRLGRPAHAGDELVVRVRHHDAVTAPKRPRGAPARGGRRAPSALRSRVCVLEPPTTTGSSPGTTPARRAVPISPSPPLASR